MVTKFLVLPRWILGGLAIVAGLIMLSKLGSWKRDASRAKTEALTDTIAARLDTSMARASTARARIVAYGAPFVDIPVTDQVGVQAGPYVERSLTVIASLDSLLRTATDATLETALLCASLEKAVAKEHGMDETASVAVSAEVANQEAANASAALVAVTGAALAATIEAEHGKWLMDSAGAASLTLYADASDVLRHIELSNAASARVLRSSRGPTHHSRDSRGDYQTTASMTRDVQSVQSDLFSEAAPASILYPILLGACVLLIVAGATPVMLSLFSIIGFRWDGRKVDLETISQKNTDTGVTGLAKMAGAAFPLLPAAATAAALSAPLILHLNVAPVLAANLAPVSSAIASADSSVGRRLDSLAHSVNRLRLIGDLPAEAESDVATPASDGSRVMFPILFDSNATADAYDNGPPHRWKYGVGLKGRQKDDLGRLIASLVTCAGPSRRDTVALVVEGFASSKTFPKPLSPAKSDSLNLEAAMARAAGVYGALDSAARASPSHKWFRIHVAHWRSMGDMTRLRPYRDVGDSSDKTEVYGFLNRRVDVRLTSAGRCTLSSPKRRAPKPSYSLR